MKKTILFDLDGTLTDSGEGIMNCAVYAMEHLGIPIPPQEELRVFVGPPLTDTFAKFGVPQADILEAVRLFRERYIPIGMYENRLYPGIRELLEQLHKDGHILCIATSKLESMATETLKYFGIDQYFHYVCGATPDHKRDAKDQVISHLLTLCDSQYPWIMVGDTAFDILGANAHNSPAIGVAWGYGLVADMENAGAITIVHSTDELLKELQK